MKSNAQATADKPRRGHSLVFSMMMILSALSAGISGIPLANATGNGEWVTVDMAKGHWESGEDVDATIKADSLNSTETYYLWWNVETVDGNDATNGSTNLTDSDGDGVEEHAVTIAATDLYDDCWNFYADLYDSSGTLLSATSFTFDVGTGMCQGGGPTGPHMWWNGSNWNDVNDTISYTAEISGLDESLQYTLDWEVTPHDDPSVIMASDEVDLTGLGAEPSVLAQVGQLGDGCYEIKGQLYDADDKEIPGSGAHFLFEVGSGVCQTGPPPQMSSVYVHYYDGELGFMGYGFENDSVFNVQISITGADGSELYSMDSDFTTDEYGMFNYSDSSISFEDGEYPVLVKVFNQAGDLVFEDNMSMLYVYNMGPEPEAGMSVWTNEMHYPSGSEVFADYYVWGNEGDNSETVWECREIFIMESALQGDFSEENIKLHSDDAQLPEWCDSIVDEAMIVNGTGGDMFDGETVWQAFEGMVLSYQYDLDLNLTITVHAVGEGMTVEEACEDGMIDDGGVYDATDDTCTGIWTLIAFDVGQEYMWQEEHANSETTFVCGDGEEEIPFDWVNDGDEDCEDGSDEPQDFDGDGTTDNWFDCHDGSTVSMDLVNDGADDCPDGEDEGHGGTGATEGYHMRYSNDGVSVVLGNIEEVYEQLYDAYVQLYDEDGLVGDYFADGDEGKVSLGHLDDGNYGVGGVLVDENGDMVWSSDYMSNFCVGPDCGGGGPPDMLTGNATLDLTVTFGDYDSANCMGGFVMLFDWYDLYMDMMSGPDDGGDEGRDGEGEGDDEPTPENFVDWFDTDGDGALTLDEIIDGINDSNDVAGEPHLSEEDENHIGAAFNEADGNADGVLDLDELGYFISMLEGDDEEGGDNGADPVWMDWETVSGPGDFTLTGLPEGDWVVIVSIGCEDPDTGEEFGAMNINGPWSLYNTTFIDNTTTTLEVDLQIMDEGGPGDGDDKDFSTGEIEFTIRIDDSADGYTALTLTQKVGFSDFFRDDIDCGFGDCNGEVSETESANAIAAYMLLGPGSGDDDGDDGGDEECPFDSGAADSPCNNQDCMDQDSQECMNAVMAYCQDHPDDPGCHMDGGDDDDDMGTPEFLWNGVLLTEADLISEDHTISGLVGIVPQDESEDTGSVAMTTVFVYMLADNGEATQVLSPAPDNDDDDGWDSESFENCEWDDYDEWYWCDDADGEGSDWWYYCENVSSGDGTWDCTDEYGPGGTPDYPNPEDGCETISVYIEDSTTWTVASITGTDGVVFTYVAAAGYHHGVLTCDDEVDGMAMTFAHVSAEEPEPPVNQPPYCDVYYYAEASDLADFQSTEDKATGSNGTWEVSIVEDDTYWLMFYCMDDEGDSITVNVTSAFGDYGETFAAGSTEGYYELTIPTGSSVLSPYTLAYTWSDGTNSGSGTVTVTVSPADGGSDGSGDETEGEDTSAGSFVPGFTAVLTMTALAGAFLVFSRREED